MKHPSDFAICISSYLTKHLAGTRNLSSNTIKSYRDTFCLLLLFMKEMNKKIDRICLVDIHIFNFLLIGFGNTRHNFLGVPFIIELEDAQRSQAGASACIDHLVQDGDPCVFSVCAVPKPRNAAALPAYSCNSDERNRKEVCGIPAGTGAERTAFPSGPDEKIWNTRYGAVVFAL